MKIENDQIASVEPFGMLDGKPVNLTCLKGGLNLATTVDAKGNDTVLGAASHRAILCYSVEQRFPSFQPMIMKSDLVKLKAEKHSHFLTDDLRKSGHDIYSIQDGPEMQFIVTKLDIRVGGANGAVSGDTLVIQSLDVSKNLIAPISAAVSEKALSSGLKKVKVG